MAQRNEPRRNPHHYAWKTPLHCYGASNGNQRILNVPIKNHAFVSTKASKVLAPISSGSFELQNTLVLVWSSQRLT